MSQQLTIAKINQEIANHFHMLNPVQKKILQNLLVDTWNAGAKYNTITKGKIVVNE